VTRVAVAVVGSRGDLEPHLALAVALAERGHEVDLLTHERFADRVKRRGLGFVAIGADPHDYLRHTRAGRLDPMSVKRSLADYRRLIATVSRGTAEALARTKPDLIVHSSFAVAAHEVGNASGTPTVGTALQPIVPSVEYPTTTRNSSRSLGPVANLASGILTETAFGRAYRQATRPTRHDGALPNRVPANIYRSARASEPQLCAFSEVLVPRPARWTPNIHVTGFWPLPLSEEWAPSSHLQRFLDGGEAPLLVGFGSAPLGDAGRVGDAVMTAARARGLRVILQSTLAPFAVAPADDVFVIEDVPYSWLIPRTTAVIHHASAGMAHEVLLGGKPSVAVPVYADHFFWARRLHAVGAAPRPLAARRLSSEALGARLDSALTEDARRAVGDLAVRLRNERGLRWATELVEAAAI
jgi:sterol 3beta-glucosyltransferase